MSNRTNPTARPENYGGGKAELVAASYDPQGVRDFQRLEAEREQRAEQRLRDAELGLMVRQLVQHNLSRTVSLVQDGNGRAMVVVGPSTYVDASLVGAVRKAHAERVKP